MDDASKILKKLVTDDGQCVTRTHLLRQTTLNMREVEKLMNEFYEKHKSLPLSAMLIVLGMKKSNDGAALTRHSVICNQDKLESVKRGFEKVISVNIYSLQHNPSTNVQVLLNVDWSGKYQKPLEPLAQRLGIISEQAVKAFESISKRFPNAVSSSFVIPPFMIKTKKEPKQLAKSIVCKSDQHSLKDAFAIAIKNNEAAEKIKTEQENEVPRKRPQANKLEGPPAKQTKPKKPGAMKQAKLNFFS